MSELSAAEQSCLAGNVDPQQVMALLGGAPGLVSPEETTALVQCLEDETLLRLFLTGLIGQTEPLSAESSVCVRSGFANFDVRSVMLATPVESDAAAAMAGSMAGFLVTLSCLNDEEWQVVGPSVGMGAEDRDGLRCVLAELGGPAGLAAALQPGAGPPTAFFGASAACNLQMTQGESGTVSPTPAPTVTPSPVPTTATYASCDEAVAAGEPRIQGGQRIGTWIPPGQGAERQRRRWRRRRVRTVLRQLRLSPQRVVK